MFLVWLAIPKFAQRRHRTWANFGIATLAFADSDPFRLCPMMAQMIRSQALSDGALFRTAAWPT
jgi:hypothetical protein